MIAPVAQLGAAVQDAAQSVAQSVVLAALLTAGGAVLMLAAGAGISGLYLLTCRIWPFRACGRCKGLGRLHAPNGKSWRDCPRCKGTGRRLRIGRRIWNNAERTKRNAI